MFRGIGGSNVDASPSLVGGAVVDGGHHAWQRERPRQGFEMGTTCGDGARAVALPVVRRRHSFDATRFEFEVEVFGEALDEAEAFRERRAALEPDLEATILERPQHVRHPVVLLDERQRDAALVGDDAQQRVEVGVVVNELHGALASRASRTTAAVAFDANRCVMASS